MERPLRRQAGMPRCLVWSPAAGAVLPEHLRSSRMAVQPSRRDISAIRTPPLLWSSRWARRRAPLLHCALACAAERWLPLPPRAERAWLPWRTVHKTRWPQRRHEGTRAGIRRRCASASRRPQHLLAGCVVLRGAARSSSLESLQQVFKMPSQFGITACIKAI